ncbi:MAG: hypothetical protein KatS3mg031_2470 [Chitinophagales bacterium]|nr:MAG: hypothetical protein KatS3mg031_2470 [Chitinophagales bacterium]
MEDFQIGPLARLSASHRAYFIHRLYKPIQIDAPLPPGLKIIVVIPCYAEPHVLATLQSLHACNAPRGAVEVILVINEPENAGSDIRQQNQKTLQEAQQWQHSLSATHLNLFILREIFPARQAGVGLARKIGMDEAAFRLLRAGHDGIIVCLDADCTVSPNYLTAIEKHFLQPESQAAIIHFEHALDQIQNARALAGIIQYEIYLRYYKHALRYCGYPFYHHTIGSCMAVRSSVYVKSGGMNRKKAGEDFYFLHKIMPLGGCMALTEATVYPSARVSLRVPFGTGKAMHTWMQSASEELEVYHPRIFDDLKVFLNLVPQLYKQPYPENILQQVPHTVAQYLEQCDFMEKLQEMDAHSRSPATFLKRFYFWLDGLRILKIVHYMRDRFYPNIPICIAARQLLEKLHISCPSSSASDVLEKLRWLDKTDR